jgi:hypothetical protein
MTKAAQKRRGTGIGKAIEKGDMTLTSTPPLSAMADHPVHKKRRLSADKALTLTRTGKENNSDAEGECSRLRNRNRKRSRVESNSP